MRAIQAYLFPRRRCLAGGRVLPAQGRQHFLEAICVVSIVAILSAIALESYLPVMKKFMLVETAGLATTYRTEAAVNLAVTGQLPETILGDSGSRYFTSIHWQDAEIIFELNDEIAAGMRAEGESTLEPLTLSFRVARLPTGERPVFLCGLAEPPTGFVAPPVRHTSVPEQFLPSFCRI